ncbi:hypothetical protein F4780DRAFT_322087 [Xylariomycetidae sp. FL0641]|nr:hypothetical protein F4780DRAFT_322087 [Xylariomycetidae sp. FL0641]
MPTRLRLAFIGPAGCLLCRCRAAIFVHDYLYLFLRPKVCSFRSSAHGGSVIAVPPTGFAKTNAPSNPPVRLKIGGVLPRTWRNHGYEEIWLIPIQFAVVALGNVNQGSCPLVMWCWSIAPSFAARRCTNAARYPSHIWRISLVRPFDVGTYIKGRASRQFPSSNLVITSHLSAKAATAKATTSRGSWAKTMPSHTSSPTFLLYPVRTPPGRREPGLHRHVHPTISDLPLTSMTFRGDHVAITGDHRDGQVTATLCPS